MFIPSFVIVVAAMATTEIMAAKHIYRETQTFRQHSNTTLARGKRPVERINLSYPGKMKKKKK